MINQPHPGRVKMENQQEEGGLYPVNPKLIQSNQGTMDEMAGQQARIEGNFQNEQQAKAQQVDELATAIATGQIDRAQLEQLPPQLVQEAVQMVEQSQIQNAPAGQGIVDPGLANVQQPSPLQQQAAAPQQDPFDMNPEIAGLAEAIQTGAVSPEELQQMDPNLVQAAVEMLQQ